MSSFPSAHTGLSILVAYCMWPYLNRFLKAICCLTVVGVALSRITLAMHYPSDILYSCLVTTFVIIFGNIIFKFLKDRIIIPIGNKIFVLLFS